MSLREDLMAMRNGFEISNNRFVNIISQRLVDKIKEIEPSLGVTPSSRTSTEGMISLLLTGIGQVEEDKSEKIDLFIKSITNEVELLDLVDE